MGCSVDGGSFLCLVSGNKQSTSVLTSNRRRPDQTSTPHVCLGWWETELPRQGSIGLGGVKHWRTKVRC